MDEFALKLNAACEPYKLHDAPATSCAVAVVLPEKEKFLKAAAENNYYLWLEHDAHNQIITVENTEKGVRLKEIFRCEDILS